MLQPVHSLIPLPAHTHDADGFRLRGREVSRVEAFSDAVFALAVTLMIVSVEVPRDFAALMDTVKALPVFAACFGILLWFWHGHYVFFRRYALTDMTVVVLNSLLLFVILFYVYPLKFLFAVFLGGLLHLGNTAALTSGQVRQVYILYGTGFAAVAVLMAVMFAHAGRRWHELGLSPLERHLTRGAVAERLGLLAVALLSIVLALTVPDNALGVPGYAYVLTGVTQGLVGWWFGSRAKRFPAAE